MPNKTLEHFLMLNHSENTSVFPFMRFFESISSDLMEEEGQELVPFDTKLTSEQKKDFLYAVESSNFSALIKLAISNPKVNMICHSFLLNDIWNEKWRLSGRNPKEKAIHNHMQIHEYLPQSTLSTFDLLKAIFIYSQYVKHKNSDNPESAEKYLVQAAMLGSFPALNVLCTKALHKNEHEKALFYAQSAAKLYWTPGYLLLSVTHYNQGNYLAALQNLIIAQKLIPHSGAQLNNAYQGRTVEEMASPLVQQLGVKNWAEALQQLADLADVSMAFVTTTMYKQADEQIKELLFAAAATSEANIQTSDESIMETSSLGGGFPTH